MTQIQVAQTELKSKLCSHNDMPLFYKLDLAWALPRATQPMPETWTQIAHLQSQLFIHYATLLSAT